MIYQAVKDARKAAEEKQDQEILKKGIRLGLQMKRDRELRLRPPVLDDIRSDHNIDANKDGYFDIWSDEYTIRNDADAARYWAAKHGEALQTIQDLRSDLSAARFERSIWWPLAFCVGVLCGTGLSYVW